MQESVREQIMDGDSDLAERVSDVVGVDAFGRSIVSIVDPRVKAKRRAKNRQARASRKANRSR